MMAIFTRARLIGLGIALAIFAADQWMKNFVVGTLGLTHVGDHYPLLPFFDFTRTNNYGVSLGMFSATSMEMRWALVVVTALIALAVFVWIMREVKMWDIAALSLILGGALGNIRDRFMYGYVIDYADFHIGTIRPFMIFNVADAAITIGVVILLARALFIGEKPATEQDEITAEPNPAETD
ncbi:signal peptidase II [Alteraurantiacibacter aquimixticola]|uniref:Lipoprotein signal peptidase n=1 Tax=Alteraurantiacibacter aquimixticola TaxID=2489173 RepID=A0A4T3EXG4_9SPHN|nr:signal peptidase II [Alteraurantiacibacter aquimixticola]TIX49213.1 signal peptidase II [Alteraurantiacibacter aquimixticola]